MAGQGSSGAKWKSCERYLGSGLSQSHQSSLCRQSLAGDTSLRTGRMFNLITAYRKASYKSLTGKRMQASQSRHLFYRFFWSHHYLRSIEYFFYFFLIFFISWRLITLQYCSGFCHTLKWISHGFTCVPHPDLLIRMPSFFFFFLE